MTRDELDEFLCQAIITIPTPANKLIINWSHPTGSANLFHWEKTLC